jgi:hypothetical protein
LRGLVRNGSGASDRTPILLASGERGVVLVERQQEDVGISQNLVAGVYHGNRFYVVGENEVILQQTGPLYLSRLGNLATRGAAGGARGTLIGGLTLGGSQSKRVLIRAVGPSLSGLGVSGAMPRPSLTGYDSAGNVIVGNAGWNDAAEVAVASRGAGAFSLAAGSLDAALVSTLTPGSYTFHIQPVAGTGAGVVLFEAYDIDNLSNTGPRLLNVSTRGFVGGESETLIGGLVITGSSRGNVLVRGIGPTLRSFGVSDAVNDCALSVFRGEELIASNDDWGTNANASQLGFIFHQLGAFELGTESKDSALLLSNLAPGAYTVQLTARGGSSGAGLIEIYDLP